MRRLAVLALALATVQAGAGEAPEPGPPAPGTVGLEVVDASGARLFEAALPRAERWCLVWNHSVTGIEVSDCFGHDAGHLVLERSHQPDFAAGLGDLPGRGRVVSDGAGGYWIEDIGMRLAGDVVPLRVGSARVDHRLRIGGEEHSLSALAAGQLVRLRLQFGPGSAE